MSSLSLESAAKDCGERLALLVGSQALTFGELHERVLGATAWLLRQDVAAAGVPVGLVFQPRLAEIELFWALFGLGRPVLLLHPRQAEHERQALLGRAGATLVDAASWALARTGFAERASTPERVDAARARVIVPTSGSTGRPKLCVLSERALAASAQANWQNMQLTEDERWLACLPFAHVGGLSILTRMLFARRAAVVYEAEGGLLSQLGELERTLASARISLVSLVPTVLDALLAQGFAPTPSLRAVLLGGAAPGQRLLERAHAAGVPLLTTYGLTEAASQVTTRRFAERRAAFEFDSGQVSCGPPLPGVELRIAHDSAIEIRGPNLQNGYWDDDASLTDDGFFRTSDRGTWNARGELVVHGRRDDLIITGGENVDPLAVEAVLSRLPELRNACVFGLDDERWGKVVAAALSFAGQPPELMAVARFCAENLAVHERPRLVAIVPALPETASGKVDRRAVARSMSAELLPLPGVNPSR